MIFIMHSYTLKEFTVLPNVDRRSKSVIPHQQYRDDFLDTMTKIFLCSRWFGVTGSASVLWKMWGSLMVMMMVSIEAGAIYKLIKLLLGLTAYSAGNRSITSRLAGTIFYTTSFLSLILSWRLSSAWRGMSTYWASIERRIGMAVPIDVTLKRRMITVMCVMAICAFLEHVMSILASTDLNVPASMLLQQYILSSHAFILIPSDYSLWIAIPLLFMSNIATILWSFQDLIIVMISMGLASRYHRLNQFVAKMCCRDRSDYKWCKNTEILKVYTWRKIREAYVKQAMLVRKVDGTIGGLVLLSSCGNFYFICLQLFLGITQGITGVLIKRLYYMISLAWLCIRFGCMVLAAADVNVHSRNALRSLHSCHSVTYNVEIERLQNQLTKDFVALSGKGFFYIDRNMLLQMVGAIVTYELVLIQFDGKAATEHVPLDLNVTAA